MKGINHKLELCIVEDIGRGISISSICKKHNRDMKSISYYLARLKRCGFVAKRGYGTWEKVQDYDQKKSELSEVGRSPSFIKPHKQVRIIKPDVIRTHGLCFKLWIPRLRYWANRQGFLEKKGYRCCIVNKSGVKAMYKGRIVHLFPNSILVYGVSDFYGRSAGVGVGKCVEEFFKVIHGLERLMGTSFRRSNKHKFKVFRGHAGNVSNELAKAYIESGHGKYVGFDKGSAWLQIDGSLSKDGSFSLKELETIQPESFERDMDQVIMPFFNDQKKHPEVTASFVLTAFNNLIEDRKFYAENQRSHIGYLKQLGEETHKLGDGVNRLVSVVEDLKPKPKKFGQLKIHDF